MSIKEIRTLWVLVVMSMTKPGGYLVSDADDAVEYGRKRGWLALDQVTQTTGVNYHGRILSLTEAGKEHVEQLSPKVRASVLFNPDALR